jgi:NAD(P)-dependent dehydrogenase (short-subunit alcohol dehydrogenase family)
MGETDDLAGLVAYLASDVSRYMYGQDMIIDGVDTLV